MMNGSGRRALIVKFGAIGDVIMAIPAAHALHVRGWAVDWVCGGGVAPLLGCYPWIRVIVADDKAILQGSPVERLRALTAVWKQVAGVRYELCATLYYDARYRLVTLPVRARRKIMLSASDRKRMLLPGRHHTDEYARILLGVVDGERPQRLKPVPAQGLPEAPLARDTRPRIVLAPAGAKNMLRDDALRRWPVESYAALAQTLVERGMDVVLIGGPDDMWAVPFFSGLGVTDLMGRLTLPETLALLNGADAMVTHDTGPLHLAGITQASIVSVFGPTDPWGRLPQRAGSVAIWGGEGFACRPCYDGSKYAPCLHNGCVRQVTVAMVLKELTALLEQHCTGLKPPQVVLPESTVSQDSQ